MELYVSVEPEGISNKNGIRNVVNIVVDLSCMWTQIVCKYTHVNIEVYVGIPVLENEKEGEQRELIYYTFCKDFEVCNIVGQKVSFEAVYASEMDRTRPISGYSYIRGYRRLTCERV